MKYTKENLAPVIAASFSYGQVLDRLGLRRTGGGQSHLKNLVKRFEIDTGHFLGQGWSRGKRSGHRKAAADILILRSDNRREKVHILRRAMIEVGFQERCECGQGKEWNGKRLVLEIDHKNGNAWDNRPENLRFLCPNCHSQCATGGMVDTQS